MVLVDEIKQVDGPRIRALKPPTQRAAYSDRTAWQMAILAELAYVKFEKAQFPYVKELAQELAGAAGADAIEDRLSQLQHAFDKPSEGGKEILRVALKAAGFELVDTFYNQSLNILKNTEGFVAEYVAGDKAKFAVLAIRGTTSPQDWMKNANAGLESIGGNRQVHKGFHSAFTDAKDDIDKLLMEVSDLPLYVTGHSLGGAVAVMATWYYSRDTLAACYTFGAPRVGNHVFNDSFCTPIYRVVNSQDPVPMVPPSGATITSLKFVLRLLSRLFLRGLLTPVIGWLKKVQGYRHAGDLRYMTAGDMEADGSYPTVKYYTHFSMVDRAMRVYELMKAGQMKRLDKYHNMSTYRRKLRHRALDRAPK